MLTHENWFTVNFYKNKDCKKIKANTNFVVAKKYSNWKNENLKTAEILYNIAKKNNKKLTIMYSGGSDSTVAAASFANFTKDIECIIYVSYVKNKSKNFYFDTLKSDFLKNNFMEFHNCPDDAIILNVQELILAIKNLTILGLEFTIFYDNVDDFISNEYYKLKDKIIGHHPEFLWQINNSVNLPKLKNRFIIQASAEACIKFNKEGIACLFDKGTKNYQYYAWSKFTELQGTPFFPMYTKELRMANIFDKVVQDKINNKKNNLNSYNWNDIKINLHRHYFPNLYFTTEKTIYFPLKEECRNKVVDFNHLFKVNFIPLSYLLNQENITFNS